MATKRKPAKSTKKPSDNNTKTSSKAENTVASAKKKTSVKAKNTEASEKKTPKVKAEKNGEKTVGIYENGLFLKFQILHHRLVVAMPVL